MTLPAQPAAPNATQLRAAIDSGAGRTKVNALDPAAAPMETDAEAGGAPPTAPEVAQAHAHETAGARRSPAVRNSAMPLSGTAGGPTTAQIIGILAAGFLALVILGVFAARHL